MCIAELLIELHRVLEQRQFRRILGPLVDEAGVQDAAAGQGKFGSSRSAVASPVLSSPKTARSYASLARWIRSSTLIAAPALIGAADSSGHGRPGHHNRAMIGAARSDPGPRQPL